MSIVSSVLIFVGSAVSMLAGIGLLKFSTPYARFHAAGKASPVAFLFVALGASLELGWAGAAQLGVASLAMVLTLPVGVHLLFRAVHRTTPGDHLVVNELTLADSEPTTPDS